MPLRMRRIGIEDRYLRYRNDPLKLPDNGCRRKHFLMKECTANS